jgi:hypothetical protein
LPTWMTEFHKGHSHTPQEELCFFHFHSMLHPGMLWKMWKMFLLLVFW